MEKNEPKTIYDQFKEMSKSMKITVYLCLFAELVGWGLFGYYFYDLRTKFEQRNVQIERFSTELHEAKNQLARIKGE